MRYVDQHLDYGYGQFEKAIVCRSLDQMNRILQTEQILSQHFKGLSDANLSPLELAIGWPSGLQKLLEAGFSPDGALQLSMHMEDLTSTRILLAADNFPGDNVSGWPDVLYVVRSAPQEIQQVVAQALRQRRQALAKLAIEELVEDELLGLGLSNEKTLDVAALNVYQRLKEKSVEVPPNLNPTSVCYQWKGHCSVYPSLFRSDGTSPEVLDNFFENGFESVDTSDEEGRTPLLLACREYASWVRKESIVHSIDWLLDKRACPNFPGASWFPNILFYIAIAYGRSIRSDLQYHCKHFARLVRRSALLCDPLYPDGCHCYCSSTGCLPFHKFWRCGPNLFDHRDCQLITSGILSSALEKWICLCGLDEAQSELCHEEICRLEVFNRLGMAHTCCEHKELRRRTLMPEEDRKQLQEEDKELKEQLDLILQAYRCSRKKHAGDLKNSWKDLWQKLHEILPDLEPEKRCRQHCLFYIDDSDYEYSEWCVEKEMEWHNHKTKIERRRLPRKNISGSTTSLSSSSTSQTPSTWSPLSQLGIL